MTYDNKLQGCRGEGQNWGGHIPVSKKKRGGLSKALTRLTRWKERRDPVKKGAQKGGVVSTTVRSFTGGQHEAPGKKNC